ncbi:MAG: tetratricopeptide repeat protein [Planctomycetales bacterium]|nr:tetratricopeptide repeat protein [Planctomycetales bacterium]
MSASDPVRGGGSAPGARPFLTDFGLAKRIATGSKFTRTGEALGTPAYMSPEQARGETSSLAAATDVWGIGCVLHELLTGRRAFEGGTAAEVIARVLAAEPPRLRTLRPDAPAALGRVVAGCLGKPAARRYADAGAVRDDLDRLLRGEPVRAPRPALRLGGLLAAGLLAAAGGSAALALAASGRPPPSPVPPAPTAPADPAEALVARARERRGSDPLEAAGLLGQALRIAPAREDLRVERGLLLWAAGDGAAARAEWARVPAGSPEEPRARLFLGLEAFFAFRGEEAVPHYEAAAGGTGPEATLARGALAEYREDWSRAREILRDIGGWEAALVRAHLESVAPGGDRAFAEREYGRALSEGPSFAWARNNRGALRRELGDLDGAREDLDLAVRALPAEPGPRFNRASLRILRGDLRGALEDYDAVLLRDPRDARALASRGVVRKDLGDVAGALGDFDGALAVEPGDVRALSNRGAMRRALGDLRGALADYDEALRRQPDDPDALYNRGNLRRTLGDARGALGDYDEAVRLRPAFGSALANRGVARKGLGDLSGAIADFEEAIRVQADLPGPHANLGFCLQDRGELRRAAESLGRFLRLAPDHPTAPEARRALAECERGLRERGEIPPADR